MVKRFVLLVVLLAGTALTVLLGEGFNFLNTDPTATTMATSTLVAEATATTVFTETAVPTSTAENTSTTVPTSTTENTATATASPTSTPIPTNTAAIIATKTATATPTKTATATPTKTATITPVKYLFKVQLGSPVYTTNFAHPEAGCNWEGVAGQVLSSDGSPLKNYVLKIKGTYNGAPVNQIGLSGLVANEPYGPGSFEFILGSTRLDSKNQLNIQLFSPAGVEMIAPVSFNTSVSCSYNLMIINFKQK